jgi:hypothetical protein
MPIHIPPDSGMSQGAHTERLGVVSGQPRVLEVAGDVQNEQKPLLPIREP